MLKHSCSGCEQMLNTSWLHHPLFFITANSASDWNAHIIGEVWWGGRWFSEWAVSDPRLCLSSVGSFHLLLFVHECECMTDRNAHGHWYCHSLVSTLHKFFRIVLSIFLFKESYHIMSIWGCSFGKCFFGFAFVFFQFVTRWQYYADVNHCPCWLFTFLM